MPEPPRHPALPGRWSDRRTLAFLVLAAVAAHGLALAGIRHQRGQVTAYAFQSPDGAEYVALARGLAWQGKYLQLDPAGRPLTGPDTWRTPGYPLFLAGVIRLWGESPLILLLVQQLVAAATVPLLWLILRRVCAGAPCATGTHAAPVCATAASAVPNAAPVSLLPSVRRFFTPHRLALFASLAWCFDPFRLYYSFWLMSETLFTFVLLIACWVWVRRGSRPGIQREDSGFGVQGSGEDARSEGRAPFPPLARGGQGGVLEGNESSVRRSIRNPQSEIRNTTAFALGLLAGFLVLIRPIALPLPALALAGIAIADRQTTWRKWLTLNLACLLGIALTLGPWLLRNRIVAGHFALSQQSGASLAYHKVVDVVLWSEGRPEYRFDPAVTAEVRERIDTRLRHEWPDVHGPATAEQLKTLTWRNLNFGKPVAVDPFEASKMLWSIGLDMLTGRLWPTVKCFAVQGLFMLVFPLGLVLWPPAGAGSAPLSMLSGAAGGLAAKAISALIGLAYAALTLWVLIRLAIAVIHRHWPAGVFVFWPALAMFAFSLPSEDPRFRLPIIPLLWILAVAQAHRRPTP